MVEVPMWVFLLMVNLPGLAIAILAAHACVLRDERNNYRQAWIEQNNRACLAESKLSESSKCPAQPTEVT